ncbi:MAG: hypothetical protein AAGI38_25100 [Bacteroidota bacterium]
MNAKTVIARIARKEIARAKNANATNALAASKDKGWLNRQPLIFDHGDARYLEQLQR